MRSSEDRAGKSLGGTFCDVRRRRRRRRRRTVRIYRYEKKNLICLKISFCLLASKKEINFLLVFESASLHASSPPALLLLRPPISPPLPPLFGVAGEGLF